VGKGERKNTRGDKEGEKNLKKILDTREKKFDPRKGHEKGGGELDYKPGRPEGRG